MYRHRRAACNILDIAALSLASGRRLTHVPEELRGTYAGLGSTWAIDYFKHLGVTAVELLPVHAHIDDKALVVTYPGLFKRIQ